MRTESTLAFARATFGADASFAGCEFARGVDFAAARFSQRLNLERSVFPSIDVGGASPAAARDLGEASTVVALRGAQYAIVTSRSQGTKLAAGGQAKAGGNRATLSQRDLAAAFYQRRTREGDAVNPARQSPSGAAFWADSLRLLGDRSLRWLTGYGVRPVRTLAIAAAAPLIAFTMFLATSADPPACVRTMTPATAMYLTVATYTSADRFMAGPPRAPMCGIAGTALPAVDVERANRMAGLILLPLMLLTVTGVLRALLGWRR
jgi:hypothetical protein